jgi:hypothetical protein
MRNLYQLLNTKRLATGSRQILKVVVLVLLLATAAACGPSAQPADDGAMQTEVVEPTAEAMPGEEEAQPIEEAQPTDEVQGDAAQESYPPQPPTRAILEENYPVETPVPPTATPFPDVYPPPTVTEVFAEPRIRLDLPVTVNDTEVSGTAPPGLELAAVDITYNGALLGSGTTGSDGRFTIPVEGLVEGNRLGLTFAELEAGLSLAEMSVKYFPHRGEGFMNLPNVGIMLDTTLIQP